ncbi:AarF/UbiB family protein [Sphingosinicella sp. BN140058]|uniref:AarF/UbiB family protein n=1 Tax=Sphingosinicella sp. BN140058 TaxID=1892855 RepID=UPI0013E9D49F|nr:AarF/UbiB family protein [Sphingosinicella sp. BN140058]
MTMASTSDPIDLTATAFLLPADVKCLAVKDLSARLRERIGPVGAGQAVLTRPGFRLVPRLIPEPLAALLDQFRTPSLITDAVLRFSRLRAQEPETVLDHAFDALAALITGGILVPIDSDAAATAAPEPSLGSGQAFGAYEIQALVRSLDDVEVYRARCPSGAPAALKIARDDRAGVAASLANEARTLARLGGADSPKLFDHGTIEGRAFIAMEWCEGTSIAAAARQARAARDRTGLHALIGRMFAAYARLHAAGILHGDVHTGNILVRPDGRVVILDFGAAVPIDAADAAPRTGIPHFHDPDMALALLEGRLPPPASARSEQYGLCVLAYLLATGEHPQDAAAVQETLLRSIVERHPLPFAARGVAAWPDAEAILERGLAKQPERRFPDVAALAASWARAAPMARTCDRTSVTTGNALGRRLDAVRRLGRPRGDPVLHAWFALRAAIALEDCELLAAARILAARARPGQSASFVSAQVARAASDARGEQSAIDDFLASASALAAGPARACALVAAATLLKGPAHGAIDHGPLLAWVSSAIGQDCSGETEKDAAWLHAQLALCDTPALVASERLRQALGALAPADGDVWLWADAHRAFEEEDFKRRAHSAPRSGHRARQGFAHLRLHQLTGACAWIDAARSCSATADAGPADLLDCLLEIELIAPERAQLPFFLRAERAQVGRAGAAPAAPFSSSERRLSAGVYRAPVPG